MFSFLKNSEAKYEKIFFDLSINNTNGKIINFSDYKGQTVLLVNVASKCGFTKQYTDLQKLYENYKDNGFLIVAVPSNQFGEQEPGTDEEIKNFCETNFNISFPITTKVNVKGKEAHEIFLWAKNNHGNKAVPKWNFHKILINKSGKIEETYNSFVNPLSKKLISKLEKIL